MHTQHLWMDGSGDGQQTCIHVNVSLCPGCGMEVSCTAV